MIFAAQVGFPCINHPDSCQVPHKSVSRKDVSGPGCHNIPHFQSLRHPWDFGLLQETRPRTGDLQRQGDPQQD